VQKYTALQILTSALRVANGRMTRRCLVAILCFSCRCWLWAFCSAENGEEDVDAVSSQYKRDFVHGKMRVS
jgi:hypothetical protein